MADADRIAMLEARVADLERVIAGLRSALGGGAGGSDVASDRELDGKNGDPQVQLIPREWTSGGVAKGVHFSRCPADFLDVLADTYEFFAQKNDGLGLKSNSGIPKSVFDRRSAKLARGWARRIRDGWTPPPPPPRPTFSAQPSVANGGGTPTFGGKPLGFGGGFGNGGFGARHATTAAAPAPAPTATPTTNPDDDISFDFGANVQPASARPEPTVVLDEDEQLL